MPAKIGDMIGGIVGLVLTRDTSMPSVISARVPIATPHSQTRP